MALRSAAAILAFGLSTAHARPQMLQELDSTLSPEVVLPSVEPRDLPTSLIGMQSVPQAGPDQGPVNVVLAPEVVLPVQDKAAKTKRDTGGPMFMEVAHGPSPRSLRKREDGSAPEVLQALSDLAYYATLEMGTPPQRIKVQLDTGSNELWVNPDCRTAALSQQPACAQFGKYNPYISSTAHISKMGNRLGYGIGAANITYVVDRVFIPGTDRTMDRMQFGVASATRDLSSGILGIGFGQNLNTGYKNFVDELKAQNVTETKSFGIALGSKQEKRGSIVFGGVDTSKYAGKLAPVPIIPFNQTPDGQPRYWVEMQSITHSPPGQTKSTDIKDSGLPVVLDTGSTLSLLPETVVSDLAQQLESSGDESGLHAIDCAKTRQDGAFDFAFGDTTIRVPYSDMIRKIPASLFTPEQCYLGVMASANGSNIAILGDTFLRSAYTVFDLEGMKVHMAPYANCGSTRMTVDSPDDFLGLEGRCSESDIEALRGVAAVNDEVPEKDGSGDKKEDSKDSKQKDQNKKGNKSAATRSADAASTAWHVAVIAGFGAWVVAGHLF